jgi:hypothetical protein
MNLYAHQQEVVTERDRLDRLRFGNWRGTGSGKTRTTVAIAEGVTVVICPKTQADEGIWKKEWLFQNRNPDHLRVWSKEQFKKQFLLDPSKIAGMLGCDTLIIDEAHTAAGVQPMTRQKNYVKFPRTSQIYDAVKQYVDMYQPKRIHPLTATPAPNPLAVFALGSILGRSWDYFKFRETFYIEKKIRGRHLWLVNRSKTNKELLLRTIRSIGYTGSLQDWFDVPEQTFHTHNVGVTAAQEKAYRELKLLYPDPLVQAGKRQMLEQGLFEGTPVKENKIEAIEYYLEQFDKVVVFARYTDQIEMYRNHFEQTEADVYVLNGATKNRKEMIEQAQRSDKAVFIAQCAISAGWELPDFPCMIFGSMDYSFVNYDQAIGRILRANHLKKNLYVFLIAGDGDAKVVKTVHAKENFSSEKAFLRKYAKELCENKKLKSHHG